MADPAFFEPLEQTGTSLTVLATEHARGPWDPRALHAGPPAALLAHAIDAHHPAGGRRISRVTCEILRPVPVGRLVVRTTIARPGHKVELLQGTIEAPDGTPVMTAAVWRIRTADLPVGAAMAAVDPLPDPEMLEPATGFFRPLTHHGWVQSMDVRFVRGHWAQHGPATAWLRARVGLVAGRSVTPVERLLVAADSGNGLACSFDGTFVNVDLTVHLARLPDGEWIGIDAATAPTDDGIGFAHTVIHDRHGPVGRGAQSLLLDPTG